MILKGYPRISETFISNEILLLEKLGFSIHLFSMRRPRERFSHKSVKEIRAAVDYLPETLLIPLPRLLYHNIMLAGKRPGHYSLAFRTALKRFVRTRKSATIKHLLQAGYLVHHLLSGSGVTHLHAHFAHSPTSVAMFAGQLSGLPYSFTAHAKDIYTSDPRQIREKIVRARFVVTCTAYNKHHLMDIASGCATPIHHVYHGIDTDLFSKDRQARKSFQPYRILTVARMTSQKGLPTVYRALRHLIDMAIGVPVVATNISAIPELIENGKTGLLVPAGQPDKMARAMARLLTDEDLRERVITAARKLVETKFDNKALTLDLANIHRREIAKLRN